jgi:DNA-binding SARP family transcriptional activator
VTVDEAAEALWGASPPPAARNAIQGHISALRKLLRADRIDTRDGYRIRVHDAEPIRIDSSNSLSHPGGRRFESG